MQTPVVVDTTVTVPPAVDESVTVSVVPFAIAILSAIAGKTIAFVLATITAAGSMYIFDPIARPPVASYVPLTKRNL